MTAKEVHDHTLDAAIKLDDADPLREFRSKFIFPSKADLKSTELAEPTKAANVPATGQNGHTNGTLDDAPSTYLCGNSLGLQPRQLRRYVDDQLRLWATKGVYGHFRHVAGTPIVPWLAMDDAVAAPMAALVGAEPAEVAVMQTLTANLHLLLSSFYRPTAARHKIIMEAKAFPSDHFVVESQLRHHGRTAETSMVLLEPPSAADPLLSTAAILAAIDAHAADAALLLLPGIQFYTGQLFDVPRITAHAQARGLVVGWDLAHAAGNVPLALHAWGVDFAAWCSYKYLNAGPGAIGALFVHARHAAGPPRLAGWWGSDKRSRFDMTNAFAPIPGAKGWQLSNPSALDMAALQASLALFAAAGGMAPLRAKSVRLTAYLESLLDAWPAGAAGPAPYRVVTPRDPEARGAQLSVRLAPGLLPHVQAALEAAGIVVDERKPDVVRVAPAPLYNSFADCWRFCDVFQRACRDVVAAGAADGTSGGGAE